MSVVGRISNGRGVVIGLEAGNIERLKNGKPFHYNMAQSGGEPFDIFIVYGETADDLHKELMSMSPPDVPTIDNRNRRKQ